MPRTLERRAALAVLSAIGMVLVYRATTQSVVYDEAFTYLTFLAGPPSLIFTTFTANNHVLFSLLSRASIGLFGVSALALRLPSVVGGVVYLAAASTVCRRAFGATPLYLIALATLTLNPLVLDFFVAARGYGVALALFMLALHQSLRLDQDPVSAHSRRCLVVSVALGLSVSANLTFMFPATALIGMSIVADISRSRNGLSVGWLRHLRTVTWRVVPGALLAAAILVGPLSVATAAHFDYGADSISQTALSLVDASLRYGRDAWPADPEVAPTDGVGLFALWGVILPGLAVAATLLIVTLRDRRHRNAHVADGLILIAGGTLLVTLAELVAAHWAFGVPYPFGRTGLYLLVLFLLTMAGAANRLGIQVHGGAEAPPYVRLEATSRGRVMSIAVLTLLALLAGRFISEFGTGYFYHWRYDAGTRDIFHEITARQRERGQGVVRVAAAQVFAPSLEFYGVTEGNGNVIVDSEHWLDAPSAFDYFVVSPGSGRELERTEPGLARVVYVHDTSGAVLMENMNRVQR